MEALSHLTQGLALLQTLPEIPERLEQEVDLLIALGASLRATKGHAAPEVEQTYSRARHLCQRLADPYRLFPVLRGLWNYYYARAEMQTAQTLGEQLLSLAQHTQNPGMLLAAHRALGTTLFFLGMVAAAYTHLTQGIALYEAQQHRPSAFQHGEDSGVVLLSRGANVLWVLGYPDQGLGRSQEAVTMAQQRGHPYSLGYALSSAARCHQLRREAHDTQACAEAMLSLAQEQGFSYFLAYGACYRGWALAQHTGQTQEGIAQLTQGLEAYRATGAEVARSLFLALLAEAHGTMGQSEVGLTALAEALTIMDKTGERVWKPELYRLKGILLLQQSSDNQAEAEACFHHALDMARTQQARSFELRAATSLARLWQQQGKRAEAHALLAPVYDWFTEGFDTADLQEAKALLDALA